MKQVTPDWRSSQVRGNLVGLTNSLTGKFETFGYTGPGAKGRVDLAPFLFGLNKYLCSVPATNQVMTAICKEFGDREDDIHLVGGFMHKRLLKEQRGMINEFLTKPLTAAKGDQQQEGEGEGEAEHVELEGSEYIALTPDQVRKFSQQQTRGQTSLALFGLPYYMSILRPLHYHAKDLKNANPEEAGEGEGEGGEKKESAT